MRLASRWSARQLGVTAWPLAALGLYAAGVLAASLFFNGLGDADKAALSARATGALAMRLDPGQAWSTAAARLALLDLKVVGAAWLGALLPAGRALVAAALAFRGAVTGFGVAFLFWQGGLAGLALAVPVMMAPALLQVPALAWIGTAAFSWRPPRREGSLRERARLLAVYSASFLPAVAILAAGDGLQALLLVLLRERLAGVLSGFPEP